MKPNIIIFNPDQFRTDALSHLGFSGVSTPNLDEIVQTEGVSFNNTFCQNPVCTPSRCSFMSGLYPHVNGHRTMDHMLHGEKGEKTLLRILKDEGYFVWWGGKNDLIPAQNGFEKDADIHFKPSEEDYKRWNSKKFINLHKDTQWRGEKSGDNYYSFFAGKLENNNIIDHDWAMILGALEFIENYKGEKPFVMYLPLLYPHPPYGVEEPFFSEVDGSKLKKRKETLSDYKFGNKPMILKEIIRRQGLENWSEERFTKLRKTYYGMCNRIDYQVGLLKNKLKEKTIWDESMFFFFSDHGDFTGDYGIVEKNQNTFEDSITNVPLIIKMPKSLNIKPTINNSLVELIDVSQTIYDITKIKPPYWTFGKTLLPTLKDKNINHRNAVFCEGGRLGGEIAANEHTHLENFKNPEDSLYFPRVGLQQIENPLYHGKATMIRTMDYKYVKRMSEEDEFYDLSDDKDEQKNQINNPKYRNQILELKEQLLSWYQKTCDIVPFEVDKRE